MGAAVPIAASAKKAPKVVYGLKNVHYAKKTVAEDGTVSYDKPKRIPGAVNLGLSPDGEIYEFYADDGVYYSTSLNDGYTGDIEMALIPDEFLVDVFGWEKADGGIFEVAGVDPQHIALMGEFATDSVAKRIVLYDVLCGRPDINRKTKEKTPAVQTQKMSLTCRPIEVKGKQYVKVVSTPEMSDEVYNAFFNAVKLPAAG